MSSLPTYNEWASTRRYCIALERERDRLRDRPREVALAMLDAMLDAMDTLPPTEAHWQRLRGVFKRARDALGGGEP